jgi:hypothetical protein
MLVKRKMTVVFHDENLYTRLKIEAVKRHITASDIVTSAVTEWMENREDAELLPAIEEARAEWKKEGGKPWDAVEQEITESIERRDKTAKGKRV